MVTSGQIDEIWTLSDWHTSYIHNATHGHRRMMEVLKRKTWITRNGANIWIDDIDLQKKDPNLFVFNAAANKGMQTLLEDIWPTVYEQTQQKAKLKIIGGSYKLKELDAQSKLVDNLQRIYDGKNNVEFMGYVTQEGVANILKDASYMIYPQELPETYGISTVEALINGVPVISGRFGAMEETAVEHASYLMDYPARSNTLYQFNDEAHINAFIEMTLKAWSDKYLWQQKANKGMELRDICTWDKVALEWKQHLFKVTGRYMTYDEHNTLAHQSYNVHRLFGRRWTNPDELYAPPTKYERSIMVVVTAYNAEKYVKKCIDSINNQYYSNYDVYFVNDCSTDNTYKEAADHKEPPLYVHTPSERKGALRNQYELIKDFGETYDIIMIIDGDDALVNDPYIFSRINRLYEEGYQFTYGSCWSMADDIPLIAQEYPAEVKSKKSYRKYKFPWKIPYTHLRTFSYNLFELIDVSDLLDNNNEFYKAGGDAALFYALIEKAEPDRIKAVRDITYLYNDLNPINDYKVNGDEQTRNSEEIVGNSKNKKILCAIPTAQNIHPETFRSIYNVRVPDGYEMDFQYFFGYSVDQVRNLIAHWVVNKYDYLFAVDYDISFEPDTLEKLIAAEASIASGVYIQRKPGEIVEAYLYDDKGVMNNLSLSSLAKEDGLYSVDAVGFGCALVMKEAFIDVGYPYFVYHHAIDMKDTLSEDVDFCMKAVNKGHSIVLHSGVRCNHHGQNVFSATSAPQSS